MTQKQSNRKNKIMSGIIIILSIIGLILCIAALFPHVREMILDYVVKHVMYKEIDRETSSYQTGIRLLLSYALGGICFILFLDYCTLTDSGRSLVREVKQEIKDCWSEIDFRSFLKPSLILLGVYFLGILTIIRANFLYRDDIWRAAEGARGWFLYFSRHITEILSIFVHADSVLTDISPLPQLLAILMLSVSSVLLVYIIGNKKITTVGLLASIPLGLSPYFLECLSYKFDSPYMALSILVSIVPFLFIARKKAFLFISVLSLLVMCMTYQASSGIYMMMVVVLCFQYWNSREKTNKEIISFLGIAAFAFCFAMLFFRFFLMRPYGLEESEYASTLMFSASHILSGTLDNIKEYAMTINHDFGMIWKIGIAIVFLFFITKSIYRSAQVKILSFFISILVIVLSFILSFGVYFLLEAPLFEPRAMYGLGAFLAIMCISVISDYKKIASVAVLALNWCFLVFAFSYGNALADQARYAEFRITILMHDLGGLYPNAGKEGNFTLQLKNAIEFTPVVKNIAKHYPVIEKLVPKRLDSYYYDYCYFMKYFNYISHWPVDSYLDFDAWDLPVVLDSYYHTIKSDGEHILIILKH